MDCYAVGSIIKKFKGVEDGIRFDMDDDGAVLILYFNKPTEDEIQQSQ